MVREVVSLHVGQCGLQLGSSFWHQLLQEHSVHQRHSQLSDPTTAAGKRSISGGAGSGSRSASSARQSDVSASSSSSYSSPSSGEWWRWSEPSSSPSFDGGLSTFFHPLQRPSSPSLFPYRARAVLVDMESGVLSALHRSSQSALFDSAVAVVSDVSGSGNNWAHGYCVFGPQYGPAVMECVRRACEQCDSLQAFLMTHSTGGGTGSGLGSYILEQLADSYPGVYRLDQCVLPSLERDDVVTSPYNAALSLPSILRSSDVVLPCDNQALVEVCDAFYRTQQPTAQSAAAHQPAKQRSPAAGETTPVSVIGGGFSELNVLCASVLTCLTAGMRFPGELNVDLSDLVMNCCPFSDTNLLVPALSPLQATLHHYYDTNNNRPLQQAGLDKATSRAAVPSRRREDSNGSGRVADIHAVSASIGDSTSYYFHTLNTAQSLYSAQSSARGSTPAFGSSLHSVAARGDLDGTRTGRTGSQQEDALFHSALQKSHQLLQVSHHA